MKAPESYAEFLALPDAEREELVKSMIARSEPKPSHDPHVVDRSQEPVVLHPCPFCGAVGHAVAVESFTDQRGVELWIVHCGGCLCDGPMALSPDGAATVWNVRFAIM